MKKRLIFAALALVWLGFIFWNSAQDADASGSMSSTLLSLLNLPISEHLLRKIAHFVQFALLGFLISGALTHGKMPWGWLLFTVLCCACVDETIQAFSLGRSSKLSDVWLDLVGSVTGIGAFWGFVKIKEKLTIAKH